MIVATPLAHCLRVTSDHPRSSVSGLVCQQWESRWNASLSILVMVIGPVTLSLRYVTSFSETISTDMQVGFRLKRKETADLFDSEDMQAAFINVG